MLKTILLCLAILVGVSCGSTKVPEKNNPQYVNVSIAELLNNKGLYHRKYIQTDGYYMCGFEKSDLFPKLVLYHDHDSTISMYDWSSAIWVNEKYQKSNLPCDSFLKKIITVKGIFDTSRHGHLGNYAAEIDEAVLLR